jgi:hypothetical protein
VRVFSLSPSPHIIPPPSPPPPPPPPSASDRVIHKSLSPSPFLLPRLSLWLIQSHIFTLRSLPGISEVSARSSSPQVASCRQAHPGHAPPFLYVSQSATGKNNKSTIGKTMLNTTNWHQGSPLNLRSHTSRPSLLSSLDKTHLCLHMSGGGDIIHSPLSH